MTLPLVLIGIALLALGAGACGSSHKGTERGLGVTYSAVTAPAPGFVPVKAGSVVLAHRNDGDSDPYTDKDPDDRDGRKVDEDNDSPEDHMKPENDRYHDADDRSVVSYGRPASASAVRAVDAVVKRYYAAAAADNGARACSMLSPSLARSVPEDYSEGAHSKAYLLGAKTCQEVMRRFFGHFHAQLAVPVEVTGLRVHGDDGIALVGSATMPASSISVRHELGTWKIGSLMAIVLA